MKPEANRQKCRGWNLTWPSLIFFALVGLAAMGGCEEGGVFSPTHTAEGLIAVEPGFGVATEGPAPSYRDAVPHQFYKQYLMSHVIAIKSDRVICSALESVRDKQELYTGPDAAYRLSQDLKVKRVLDTNLISVSLTGRNPAQVTAIVRAVLEAHVEYEHARRAQVDAKRQQDLRVERDNIRRQLEDLRQRLGEFRRQGEIVVVDERDSEEVVRLTALARLLTETQCELAKTRPDWYLFQEVRKKAEEAGDLSPIPLAFPEIQENLRRDPVILMLERELARAEIEDARILATHDPNDERVRQGEANLQAVREVLEKKSSTALAERIQQHAAMLRLRYEQARAAEAELMALIDDARDQAVRVAVRADEYRALERELHRVQDLFDSVQNRLGQTYIDSVLTRPNVYIVQSPTVPISPD